MVDELENAPEKQQGELLPYNNIKNEITDLYEALSPAATYNLSFSEAVASGNIVRRDISSVSISARPQKRRWRTKSSVCSVRKSAKCDFFLNLMKKSLTFRLWQDR